MAVQLISHPSEDRSHTLPNEVWFSLGESPLANLFLIWILCLSSRSSDCFPYLFFSCSLLFSYAFAINPCYKLIILYITFSLFKFLVRFLFRNWTLMNTPAFPQKQGLRQRPLWGVICEYNLRELKTRRGGWHRKKEEPVHQRVNQVGHANGQLVFQSLGTSRETMWNNLRTNEGKNGDIVFIHWLLVPIVQSEGLSDCILSKVVEACLELVAAAVVGIKSWRQKNV